MNIKDVIARYKQRQKRRMHERMMSTSDPKEAFRLAIIIYKRFFQRENEDGGPGSGNHNHAGVPGQVGGSAPSGLKGKVTSFKRKNGKMYITSDTEVKDEDEVVTLKVGSTITKIVDFAGPGKKNPVRKEAKLIKRYGGTVGKWKHTRGEATVYNKDGSTSKAELHWFECKGVGRVELRVKRRF
ncbi:MAG: hypothetical protein LIO87_05650 [Eubacterium sp.]|nr:hypothetical protein [Eubacterium sp.]